MAGRRLGGKYQSWFEWKVREFERASGKNMTMASLSTGFYRKLVGCSLYLFHFNRKF
ncbi:hypothetical protein [Neobacillus vireti]|uniref:hypothetical protein n=1 Tax=Neobacillus vireti TaxID=220686 RepID=UPI002FFDD9DB